MLELYYKSPTRLSVYDMTLAFPLHFEITCMVFALYQVDYPLIRKYHYGEDEGKALNHYGILTGSKIYYF